MCTYCLIHPNGIPMKCKRSRGCPSYTDWKTESVVTCLHQINELSLDIFISLVTCRDNILNGPMNWSYLYILKLVSSGQKQFRN